MECTHVAKGIIASCVNKQSLKQVFPGGRGSFVHANARLHACTRSKSGRM